MLDHLVEAIRRMRRDGKSCRETAEEIGVSKSTVHRIAPGYVRRCPTCRARLTGTRCLACELEEEADRCPSDTV